MKIRHLLIIDNDPDFVFLTKTLLEKHGIKVTTISDPHARTVQSFPELLDTIKTIQPDYILLDYQVFGKHLSEVCKSIRTFYDGILTLVSEKENILLQFREVFADACLPKPFNAESFLQFIDMHQVHD